MIAVVIPCYRVSGQVLDVLAAIGPECAAVYVVDDACPEGTGDLVERECRDERVRVLRHEKNRGVGAATMTGYRAALDDGATILVKLDGDGQMDPALIRSLVAPIERGEADFVKGNRFFELSSLHAMPSIRLIGNSVLSIMTKLSTGYWSIDDPTNGLTALHELVARQLPLEKISRGYFFESDMLFRLGSLRAVVCDVPIPARYADEKSSLVIRRVVGLFLFKHALNTFKRLYYNYYLRTFSLASIQAVLGAVLLVYGAYRGVWGWQRSIERNIPATSGQVMLAALPIIVGMQLLLAFLQYDIQNEPSRVLHRLLARRDGD